MASASLKIGTVTETSTQADSRRIRECQSQSRLAKFRLIFCQLGSSFDEGHRHCSRRHLREVNGDQRSRKTCSNDRNVALGTLVSKTRTRHSVSIATRRRVSNTILI